jgi:hypothetical protein
MRKGRQAVFGLVAVMAVTMFLWSPLQTVAVGSEGSGKLTGVINDYVDSAGSWHINGEWSLQVKGNSGKAEFFASLIMMRSDLWVITTGADPANRMPHTHHVGLADGVVTPLPNGWRISGNAVITGNGNAAGFSPSPIVVEITGGNTVAAANIKLTFEGAAAGHFGTQPLDGVVTFGR